jgi:hypothetical protein
VRGRQNNKRWVKPYRILIQKNRNHATASIPSTHSARFSALALHIHKTSAPAYKGSAIDERNNHPTINLFDGALASV